MKKSIYVLSVIAICLLLAPNVFSKLNGSPGAKTDSPMDGNNCTACHSGTVNSGNGLLSVDTDIPAQGYTSGQTYSIAVELTQNTINRFGFEITCEEGNFGSNKTGNFGISDPTTTKFTNNNAAVTHTQSGISGSGSSTVSSIGASGGELTVIVKVSESLPPGPVTVAVIVNTPGTLYTVNPLVEVVLSPLPNVILHEVT